MQKLLNIFRILLHISAVTTPFRAVIFGVVVVILLAVLLIKAINIFIPFTYLALQRLQKCGFIIRTSQKERAPMIKRVFTYITFMFLMYGLSACQTTGGGSSLGGCQSALRFNSSTQSFWEFTQSVTACWEIEHQYIFGAWNCNLKMKFFRLITSRSQVKILFLQRKTYQSSNLLKFVNEVCCRHC